jgi:hypothetical protein
LEELTLENSSLRSSLDTLALHAQELERKLAASQTSPEPIASPSSTSKASSAPPLPPPLPPGGSVMLGGSVVDLKRLKKEAEKVWREEERARRAAEGASSSSHTGGKSVPGSGLGLSGDSLFATGRGENEGDASRLIFSPHFAPFCCLAQCPILPLQQTSSASLRSRARSLSSRPRTRSRYVTLLSVVPARRVVDD